MSKTPRAVSRWLIGMHHIRNQRPAGRLQRAAAFSAGIAATLASGIIFSALGAGATVVQQSGSTFEPIAPCRLFDTRPAPDNIGPRSTPLGAGETHVQQVTGANGNCAIPADATAIALNATAVGATATSYLTFFPAGHALPLSSNLNVGPGRPPTPNKVDLRLSGDGKVAVFNAFGNVNVVVDVTGFYTGAPVANLAERVKALESSQSFATNVHKGGVVVAGSEPVVVAAIHVKAPSDGAFLVAADAQLGAAVEGAEARCSISLDTALDASHTRMWEASGSAPAYVGHLSTSRVVQASAGELLSIRLVCRHAGAGVQVGIGEADLSTVFVPGYLSDGEAATM